MTGPLWESISDANWDRRASELGGGIFHSLYYSHMEAARLGGQPFALLGRWREASLLIPLIRRSIPDSGYWDATSASGYPHPLFTGTDSAVDVIVNALSEYLRSLGCVSAFIRFHPLQPIPGSGIPMRVLSSTAWIDLSKTDDILALAAPSLRRDVKRLRRDGFCYSLDRVNHETWTKFASLYNATMDYKGANGQYLFPERLMLGLGEWLARRRDTKVAQVWDSVGRLVSSQLIVLHGGVGAEYYLSGTDRRYGGQGASKLGLVGAAEQLSAQGFHWFHLGGGVGGADDSLMQFKRRLGRRAAKYRVGTLITDPISYAFLTAQRETKPGFFPSYRTPS